MDRKTFLKTSLGAGLGMGVVGMLPGISIANPKKTLPMVITILHTNDTHSRIDPFPSGQYEGMAGVARRAALVKEIRRENPNTLLLDAGDVFQGTPYFNYYKGKLEYDVMSQMRYDASTLGNHEFDNGIEGFVEAAEMARFPILNANYRISGTALESVIKPYIIKEVGGIKIGIFGLGVDLMGLLAPPSYQGVIYQDPIAIAREMVQELRVQQGCDLVICLSHMGHSYQDDRVSDRVLAQQVKGIDLVIGGHTHTFLDEPEVFTDDEGKATLVNQVGFAGIHLGRIDFVFDRNLVRVATNSRSLKIFG
jgi:5'-nucleotidase